MNRLSVAYHFAAIKHRSQRRKDNEATPYINHPIEVAKLLAENGVDDPDTLIGAVLHDTIEDTYTTPEEIRNLFGENVLRIVKECSDDKSLPKEERKQLQIEHARQISVQAKLVKLADKYSNLKDLLSNPPKKWSKDEIYGYAYWSFAVVKALSGTNSGLENKLSELFKGFGITNPTDQELEALLAKYYLVIQDSV